MIESFEHVALEVQSAEASMRFYVDVFGAVETNRWESKSPGICRIIFINLGGAVIELIEREVPRNTSTTGGMPESNTSACG